MDEDGHSGPLCPFQSIMSILVLFRPFHWVKLVKATRHRNAQLKKSIIIIDFNSN